MTPSGSPPGPPPLDVTRLVNELETEVRTRRANGEYPADLERELDEMFDRFAPPSVSDSFEAALGRAESRGYITDDAPTESARLGSPQMKRVIVRTVGFYVRHVVTQVNELSGNLTRALRLLGDRVRAVEAAVPATDPRLRTPAERLPEVTTEPSALLDREVGARLASTTGRVAVLECGDGAILRALLDAGVDAYGVEGNVAVADRAAVAGLEVRGGDPLEHLRGLADDVLAGLVLRGWIETRPVGDLVEAATRAAAVVAPNGRVVIVSRSPEYFAASDPVRADLAPGRPLHAATWMHLLADLGLGDLDRHDVAGPDGTGACYLVTGSVAPAP